MGIGIAWLKENFYLGGPVAEADMTKRVGIRFQVNPEARAVLESIKEETGVPNTEALTRIMEWYASLDPRVRLALLNKRAETRQLLLTEIVRGLNEAEQELNPAGEIVGIIPPAGRRSSQTQSQSQGGQIGGGGRKG